MEDNLQIHKIFGTGPFDILLLQFLIDPFEICTDIYHALLYLVILSRLLEESAHGGVGKHHQDYR